MVSLKEESVADFYVGKSIFLTGGTGFLGKVLIEKLLYSCNGIEKIYVLIRNKKGHTPEERIALLLESDIFARLRKCDPLSLKKVVPLVGEIASPNLGLRETDIQLIIRTVSIVFHVAATLRFNEPMRTALSVNVEATRAVINLCHQLKKVDAFIYVSTAYSNTDKAIVNEFVYSPPAPLSEVYDFVEQYGDEPEVIKKLLNGRPNTYTYTKALAEDSVLKGHGNLPTAIVRPSIVLSVMKEPIPGWLDNWNGPTALLHASSQGLLCSMVGNGSNVADLIPVDLVTNLLVVGAAQCKKSNELLVYNSCSGTKNPITYNMLNKTFSDSCVKRGWSKAPFLSVMLVRWPLLNYVLNFILVTLPFFLVDLYLRFFGKPKYMRLIDQVRKGEALMTYFTSNQWQFQGDNVEKLIASLSPEDRKTFYCDPREIKWATYLDDYCVGVSKYLVKMKV